MHNSESVLENVAHEILWDFNSQTDYLVSANRQKQMIVNEKKRTC